MRLPLIPLTALFALFPSFSLAVLPASGSLTPTITPLHVRYIDNGDSVYYNHNGWICESSLVAVGGNAFPLVLEAIDGKYYDREVGNTAEADGALALYVVAVVAVPQTVVWDVPEGFKEKVIVLRVRDVNGATAYSAKRKVASGEFLHYGACYDPMDRWYPRHYFLVAFFMMLATCVAVVVVIIGWALNIHEMVTSRKQRRRQSPVGQQPVQEVQEDDDTTETAGLGEKRKVA